MATTLQDYLKDSSSVVAARKKLTAAQAKLAEAKRAAAAVRQGDAFYEDVQARLDKALAAVDDAKAAESKVVEKATRYFDANKEAIAAKDAAKTAKKKEEGLANLQRQRQEMVKAGLDTTAIDSIIKKATAPEPKVEVKKSETGDGGAGDQQKAPASLSELLDIVATNPAEATKLQQILKNNFDYAGPIDGAYSTELGNAVVELYTKRGSLPKSIQGAGLYEWLQNPTVSDIKLTGGAGGPAAPIPYRDISAPTEAAATIQRVFDTVLNREATKKEITALTKILNREEERNPSKTVDGRRTGGINRDQFLADLIKAGTYEADKKAFPGILSNLAKEYSTSKQAATATAIEQLRQTAMANGLDLDANFGSELKDWEAKIAAGAKIDDYKNKIRSVARQHLPESIRGQIDPTIDLRSAYAPYINSYAKTFGVPANQVKVADIERIALTDKGFAPIWEFEAKKRSLPGWPQTPEAYDYVDSVANQVLRDFGF